MSKTTRFEDLEIPVLWNPEKKFHRGSKNARKLCRFVYEITSTNPFNRDFRFRDQIRASSGLIMDNLAEVFEREGNSEFLQFLSIAKGSCVETRSQSCRAFDYGYVSQDILDQLLEKTTDLSK